MFGWATMIVMIGIKIDDVDEKRFDWVCLWNVMLTTHGEDKISEGADILSGVWLGFNMRDIRVKDGL